MFRNPRRTRAGVSQPRITGVTNGSLTAPQSSAVSPGNGVYAYGSSPAFPDNTYNATDYRVDVVLTEP